MNKRMSKQDRQGVRTATDIERKYNLGDISKNRDTGSKQDILLQQINQDLAAFKAQTNAKIEELEGDDKMWFYSGVPTLENHPAVEWTTDELRTKHIGDMYYDVDNGDMYLFKSNNGVYAWESCFGGGIDYDTAYNEGYNNGYTEGVANASNPLEYAGMFIQAYMGVAFPENYELTLNLPNTTNLTSLTQNATDLVKLTIKGNANGNKITFNSAFRTKNLVILDLSEFNAKIGSCTYMCYDAVSLKEIKGVLDFSECTAYTSFFNNCKALEEFRVLPNSIKSSISIPSSPNLSAETIQSIVDGFATSETALTLTLHATAKAKVTEDQIAQLTSKNCSLA